LGEFCYFAEITCHPGSFQVAFQSAEIGGSGHADTSQGLPPNWIGGEKQTGEPA
jgi:hypothetical protein